MKAGKTASNMSAITKMGEYCVQTKGEHMKSRSNINATRKAAMDFSKEERLDLRDYCGIKDPTPRDAVRNIIRECRLSGKRCG